MDITKDATNQEKENAGIWVKFDDDTEFLVGSLNSRKYKNAYGRRIEEIRRVTRKPSAEQVEEIISATYAEAVLLGWKNVFEFGKQVEYSHEKSLIIFKNCPVAREFILLTAANNDNFRNEALEEIKKNAGES